MKRLISIFAPGTIMKKRFLIIFMLVAVTLSACSYKSTQEENSDIGETQFTESVGSNAYVESSIVNRELADYLEKYSTDTFEGDYVKLDAVDGLSYVYNENTGSSGEVSSSVAIYNQGIRCGWFGIRELPKGGLQNQRQFIQFQAELSSHGNAELQAQEMIDGVVRYTFLVSDLPFVHGDTEWLIAAGLFADMEEACAEICETVDVLWSKEGAEQGYFFTVNKALISEKALAQLIEAVSFKEGAFGDTNMDKALWAQGGVPSFKEEHREIFTFENASRLAYEIKHGEATYRVPEHTIALRVDEDTWEVYSYEDTLIGTITLSDDESNPFEVNIMDFSE